MLSCPSCGRAFPEVAGARTQVCPHCGHEGDSPAGLGPAAAPAPAAPPALSGSAGLADPAAATAHAFRFFRSHYGRLLLLWTPTVLVDIVGALALNAYAHSTGIPEDPFQMSTSDQMRFLGVALPLFLVMYTVQLSLWAHVGSFVLRESGAGGASPSWRRLLPASLGLGLVLTFAYLAGLILLVVPFLIFFHWFLYAPAALAEKPRRASEAFDASRAFARERRTMGFTALVLLVWLGAALVSVVLATLGLAAVEAAGLASTTATTLVGSLAAWLVMPLVPVLPASYWALASREAAPRPVRAGAPAAERFRTTKCPKCATLVPYTATGSPVDVVCPVCGHAGRVL